MLRSLKGVEVVEVVGVAQGFNAQYDEAVESLKNAINLIKSRIGNLQKVEGEEAKKEVSELSALIPEIEEKIKDTEVSFCLISTSFGNASS